MFTRSAFAIRRALQSRGISIKQACEIVGSKHTLALAAFLYGNAEDIDVEAIEILAFVLRISLSELLAGKVSSGQKRRIK